MNKPYGVGTQVLIDHRLREGGLYCEMATLVKGRPRQ